jgi:hypothetical protein
MPAEYFDTSNYMYPFATFEETTGTVPKSTVACGVTIGDPKSAEIWEHDE